MKRQRILLILVALLTMALLLSSVVFAEDSVEPETAEEEVLLADGSYTGTANVPVSVKLTIENGKITDVVITNVKAAKEDEDPNPNHDQAAIDALTEQVLAAQSAEIEGVEGAEALTAAVRAAVKSALDESAEAAKPAEKVKFFWFDMPEEAANMIVGLLGLLFIAAIVVTLFKSKTQPAIAFITWPAILGVILVIAGRYGTIAEGFEAMAAMIKSGFNSTGPNAALFVFSVLFFGVMTDAGMFDVIINKLMKVVGDSVMGVCIMTAVIALIGHLDGGGASTFCIVIPAMLPVYKKMHMRKTTLLRIAVLAMGVLNLMPWAGPTNRTATILGIEASELWGKLLPIQIVGVVLSIAHAVLCGFQEIKRGAGLTGKLAKEEGEVALEEGEQVAANTSDLARPKLFIFNVLLTLAVIAMLIWDVFPSYVPFMFGLAIALFVNYGFSAKMHKKIINLHAGPALMMCYTLMGAAVLMGILTTSVQWKLDAAGVREFTALSAKTKELPVQSIPSVVRCLAGNVSAILPSFLGQNLPLVIGILSVPLALAFDTDSYFFGMLPVMMSIGAEFGVDALPIGIAMVVCRNCATFISPMVPATLLGTGLADVEIKDHIKSSFLYVWIFSILCMLVGVLFGLIPI